ncbi:DUF6882 domain-containing protein [Kitasatospora sp. NPDC057198]|uniref:DUF6882 domain-containing protein n=1 Tax=Kitasatospora sp. NPDC057198 TaxID=3346046 RepID=UPI00362B97A4
MEDRSEHDHAAWEELVGAARERARGRQALLGERLAPPDDVQYRWSMDEARITWSRGGTAFLTGRITMIGSVSLSHRTWLWAWANDSLPAAVLGDIEQVRHYGERHGHPVLPWPGFDYHPELVAEARLVAAAVLDADALWTEHEEDTQLHFLIHDLTPVTC